MSGEWDEFNRRVEEWEAIGDLQRLALAPLLHQGFECQETDPERSLVIFTQGRDEARRLHEPWWVLFFESWRLNALTSFLEDFSRAQPLAMELMVCFNSSQAANHPERETVLTNVLETYASIDPIGYREDLERGFAYQEGRIEQGPVSARFVLNYRRRSYLCSIGRWNDAYDLAMQSLALIDQCPSTYTKTWHCAWALYQVCHICHMLGRTNELASYADQMAELSATNQQLSRTKADAHFWRAMTQCQRGDKRDASRSFRQGMRLLGNVEKRDSICANSIAAYREQEGELQAALGVRDRELVEVTQKGMFHRICQVQLERCRLLAKMDRITAADLQTARLCANQLLCPEWFLKKLDQFETSAPI